MEDMEKIRNMVRNGELEHLFRVASEFQRKLFDLEDFYKFDQKRDGFRVSGCGMDMGFHLVYCLGQTLFHDGNSFKHRWV